ALVINTGTISEKRAEAMLLSGKTAKEKGIPVILDPVGAGVSKFRTGMINKIISEIKPDIIRMNVSELKSICLDMKNISGVDAVDNDDIESVISLATQSANETNAVIGISGVCDIITDGSRVALSKGGHEMMRKITGMGCMLSSVIGAYAGANTDDLFTATVCAFGIFGKCGRDAYNDGIGIGTYKVNFFDEISIANAEGIEIEYR
ncbi:MAG: hydroxyethylthiazole kinase, partial [Clostridia bacterium]|nr:hydroxyethylthiazole kinase [Clostridia bacterium]